MSKEVAGPTWVNALLDSFLSMDLSEQRDDQEPHGKLKDTFIESHKVEKGHAGNIVETEVVNLAPLTNYFSPLDTSSTLKCVCPLCGEQIVVDYELHLLERHCIHVVIHRPRQVRFFKRAYVHGCIQLVRGNFMLMGRSYSDSIKASQMTLHLGQTQSSSPGDIHVNGPEEEQLRQRLQMDLLKQKLVQQQRERNCNHGPHSCFLCRAVIESRPQLMRHLFEQHDLQMGLPDNLVGIEDLLTGLERQTKDLYCIYCLKPFKSHSALKSHLRKKRHVRIHPQLEIYDQFYISNYADPERDWQQPDEEPDSEAEGLQKHRTRLLSRDGLVSDKHSVTVAERSEDWSDWTSLAEELPVLCLLCSETVNSIRSLMEDHFPREHQGFDLKSFLRELPFYDQVRLVNFIRRETAQLRCFYCGVEFLEESELQWHFRESLHSNKIPDRQTALFWKEELYLFPMLEDDPLLQILESDSDTDDSDGVCR